MNPKPLRGVALSLPRTEYRRGETIEATITIEEADDSPLLIGLVCTERYWDPSLEVPDLVTGTQWEQWKEVPSSTASPQRVMLEIPASEPYTHDGTVLGISWAVVLRRPIRWRPDPAISEPIHTLP